MSRRKNPDVHGLLLVDKAAGPSSHDVVARARRALGTRAVGHTGTLDPFATGLLVLLVGDYTRLSQHLVHDDKRYLATVKFGAQTNTDDCLGEIVAEGDPSGLDAGRVEAALASFVGPIAQVPPQFSAISKGGERAYKKARRGETVALAPRDVVIHAITLVDFDDDTATLDVHTGKGVYVRALARDLGAALGVPAHLSALRRTAVGVHRVEDALSSAALDDADRARRALKTGRAAAEGIPLLDVDARGAADLGQGRTIPAPAMAPPAGVALAFCGERPVALIAIEARRCKVVRGFPQRP